MTERTLLEETPTPGPGVDASGIDPWARILATAVRCDGAIRWHLGSGSEANRGLVIYLESKIAGTAACHLDKGCAAAIVAGLLRQGDVLHPHSEPAEVRRAVAAHLAETAAHVLGDDSVRDRQEPPPCEWGPPVVLHMDLGGDIVSATLRISPQRPGGPLRSVDRGVDRPDEVELELPFVVALGHAAAEDVEDWAPGDVWLPELGWLVTPDALGGAPAVAGADPRRGALILPGAQRGFWVQVEGDVLRFDGGILDKRELYTVEPDAAEPGETDDVEVQVAAGVVRLRLEEWSSLASNRLLERTSIPDAPRSPGPKPSSDPGAGTAPWVVHVGGQLRAWAEPCRWEGSWGVRLLQVVERPSRRGEA